MKNASDTQGGEAVAIVTDSFNGRWRVIAPSNIEWVSVSWTRRGYLRAAQLAIWHACTFEERYYANVCPFDLKAFMDGDLNDTDLVS